MQKKVSSKQLTRALYGRVELGDRRQALLDNLLFEDLLGPKATIEEKNQAMSEWASAALETAADFIEANHQFVLGKLEEVARVAADDELIELAQEALDRREKRLEQERDASQDADDAIYAAAGEVALDCDPEDESLPIDC